MGSTRNGENIATEPAITAVTNIPAPMSSVNIINLSSPPSATIDVNISGEPLPNAKIVTPAIFSDKCNTEAITDNEGQKLQMNII